MEEASSGSGSQNTPKAKKNSLKKDLKQIWQVARTAEVVLSSIQTRFFISGERVIESIRDASSGISSALEVRIYSIIPTLSFSSFVGLGK